MEQKEHSPCPKIQEVCEKLIEWDAKLPEYIKRLEKVESKQESHDKTIGELVSSAAETKVYVKMILEKIDGMEGNLFGYIKQALKDATTERLEEKKLDHEERMTDRKLDYEERKDSSVERTATTKGWQSWSKDIIKMTIGALIAGVIVYIKLKAGGK